MKAFNNIFVQKTEHNIVHVLLSTACVAKLLIIVTLFQQLFLRCPDDQFVTF